LSEVVAEGLGADVVRYGRNLGSEELLREIWGSCSESDVD